MNIFNEKLITIKNTSFGGFNDEEIKRHWNTIIGTPLLAEDETVRMVFMSADKTITGGGTDTTQIRSADQLIERLRIMQGANPEGSIGFALSAGVYRYEPNKSPGFQQLKYIQNMIIDIDAHVNPHTKDRFNITIADNKSLKISAILLLNFINRLLFANGLPYVCPAYTAVTGGGYQFGVRFDRPMDPQEARKVFETFGSFLGVNYSVNDLKSQDDSKREKAEAEIAKINDAGNLNDIGDLGDNLSEREKIIQSRSEQTIIKKKLGINVPIKSTMGEWYTPFFEIDNSFKDCTHAQRIPGTINQKYDAFAYIDNDLISQNELENFIEEYRSEINSNVSFDSNRKLSIIKMLNHGNINFRNTILNNNPSCNLTLQPVDQIKEFAGIIQVANTPERMNGGEYISLSEVERCILNHFADEKEGGTAQKIKDFLLDMGISIVKDSASYIACRSPFRVDNKPSFAVYINHGRANIKDFTEDKTYNLITLWMAVYDVNKSEAIEQISDRYGIKIERGIKKDFENIQQAESVMELIQNIDTKNFIYYRKADKIISCIMKNLDTSHTETFNGVQVLADHVLVNQLGVKHPDKDFRKEFQEKFHQYILVDAFEKFEPGADPIIDINYVKYVNIWAASESYRKCWEEADQLAFMSIEEAIELIKEVCPTMYIYLLQITQKGSLEYFVNWLSCVANFKYVPTIPIFPSIEGAGKNVFADCVLKPYLNPNYVNVVNGEKLMGNFNSFMGNSNMIVIDEGNFTVAREFDQLKMFTGNDAIMVELKGVDAKAQPRRFNFMMFTNGPDPIKHTITDRRCNYFKLERTLNETLSKVNIKNVDEFREKIGKEIHKFWGIIIKTKRKSAWTQNNFQNGQYFYQILLSHPFGKLVIKMLENDWDSISLQLNERQKDMQEEKTNMSLLRQIKESFYNNEPLTLLTINKYLDAMAWKSSVSIQQFITSNNLQRHGIKIIVDHSDGIKFKLDIALLQEKIYQENNLAKIIPEFSVGPIKTMEDLRKEYEEKQSKIINETISQTVGHGIMDNHNKIQLGTPPGISSQGIPPPSFPGMTGLPSGLPDTEPDDN